MAAPEADDLCNMENGAVGTSKDVGTGGAAAVSVLHPHTGREVVVSTKSKTASKRTEVEQVAEEVKILKVM